MISQVSCKETILLSQYYLLRSLNLNLATNLKISLITVVLIYVCIILAYFTLLYV